MDTPVQPTKPKKIRWGWIIGIFLTLSLLGFITLGGIIYWAVTHAIKSSDVYQEALRKVKSRIVIIEKLGTPIEANGIPGGKISSSSGSGKANLEIPIKGPKGNATIYLNATKVGKQWRYQKLFVLIPGKNGAPDLQVNLVLPAPEENQLR